MNGKAIFIALVMSILIAAPAGLAYAGGGGAGGPGGSMFFQCYGVANGPNPPQEIEVNDQFIDPTAERIGKLKMICTVPDVSLLNGPPINGINPANPHLTCYEVTGANAHATVTYVDSFFSGLQTVKVEGASKFICTVADKACLQGCPPPTTTP